MSEYTLKDALTAANPSNIADALRKVDLGQLLTPVSVTLALDTPSQTVLLDPPPLAACTITAQVVLGDDPGFYMCADSGSPFAAGVGSVGVCVRYASPDSLYFSSPVSQLVVNYLAAPKMPLDTEFAMTGIK